MNNTFLDTYLNKFGNKPYIKMIETMVRHNSYKKLKKEFDKAISIFPESSKPALLSFIKSMTFPLSNDISIFNLNCNAAFNYIIQRSRKFLNIEIIIRKYENSNNLTYDEKRTLFNIYNIIMLSNACSASIDDSICKLYGINKGNLYSNYINDNFINKLKDKLNKHKNKIRLLFSNILIFIGIILFVENKKYNFRGDDLLFFAIAIIIIIDGAILLFKAAKIYINKN